MKILAKLSMFLLALSSACDASALLEFKVRDTKIRISDTLYSSPGKFLGMHLELIPKKGKPSYFDFSGDFLDEEGPAPSYFAVVLKHEHYLFLSTYSGGAHCCWGMRVINVDRAMDLGNRLKSASPIRVTPGNACVAQVSVEPLPQEKRRSSVRYCWNQKSGKWG